MPQMMPMNWLLMMLFLTIYIMSTVSFMYFMMKYQILDIAAHLPASKKWTWKW